MKKKGNIRKDYLCCDSNNIYNEIDFAKKHMHLNLIRLVDK